MKLADSNKQLAEALHNSTQANKECASALLKSNELNERVVNHLGQSTSKAEQFSHRFMEMSAGNVFSIMSKTMGGSLQAPSFASGSSFMSDVHTGGSSQDPFAEHLRSGMAEVPPTTQPPPMAHPGANQPPIMPMQPPLPPQPHAPFVQTGANSPHPQGFQTQFGFPPPS